MKAYGVPRTLELENPDLADLKKYGSPGSMGNVKGPGGDYHSMFRSAKTKAKTRRYFKRLARKYGKSLCNFDIGEINYCD
jgi:hypothetical protein